jgi:plasmid stabilization system protein ParE
LRVLFRTEAVDDVLSARAWYEGQRSGLGDGFLHALEGVVGLVQEMPKAFPKVHGDVRRALFRRFPYAFYFRVMEADLVEVLACLHTRRAPSSWQERE